MGSIRRFRVLSLALLAAAVLGLGALGGFRLLDKVRRGSVVTDEVPFGQPAGTRLQKGRPFDWALEDARLGNFERELLAKADLALMQGKFPLAQARLEEILHTDPAAVSVQCRLAEVLAKGDSAGGLDTARTLAAFARTLELDPGHPLARYKRGRFLWSLRRFDAALADFQLASDLSPAAPLPYVALGRYYLRKEMFFQARRNFRTAISILQGGDDAPLDLLALAFYKSGIDDSAALAVDYARETGWRSPRLQLVQGLLLETAGQLDSAGQIFSALAAAEPLNPEYQWAQSTLGKKPPRARLVETGKKGGRKFEEATAAILILEPLVYRYPRNGGLWFALGEAYFQRNLFAHAVECYDSAHRFDSSITEATTRRDRAFSALMVQDSADAYAGLSFFKRLDSLDNGKGAPSSGGMGTDRPRLGHYELHWDAFKEDVLKQFPPGRLQEMPNGNLRDQFCDSSRCYEHILGFADGKLWGVFVTVTDSARETGDLFGALIAGNSRISGNGTGTGKVNCAGYKSFQGAIWENEDTFEMMGQFQGKEWQIRLARLGRTYLPEDQRICNLLQLLDKKTWE